MKRKVKRRNDARHRVLDLFAGCGGFSNGLHLADLDVVAANEIWADAAETHRINHANSVMVEGDITSADVRRAIVQAVGGSVDVIVGGPPCQAYSMAGRRAADDPRGKLFEDYVQLVRMLQPRAFVMENVKGLLTMAHDREDLRKNELTAVTKIRERLDALPDKYTRGVTDRAKLAAGRHQRATLQKELSAFQEPVLKMIERRFQELGYAMKVRVLNAADYGVPQKRERVIILGCRDEALIRYPEPTHANQRRNGGQELFDAALLPWRTVREVIDDLRGKPEDVELHHIYPVHSPDFLAKIRRTPIGQSVFTSYSDAFFRLDPDAPARTVKENHNGVFVHYAEDRVMTPRELARLQSFSDDFKFYGRKSSVLKQIGNAVPVGLGKALGHALRGMLN